ncbi:MAG TPA: DUF1592 domain-containing protein [Polyangia bacterium]|nr:DUF1592 domain-containing protein [Polyangia bacterium]
MLPRACLLLAGLLALGLLAPACTGAVMGGGPPAGGGGAGPGGAGGGVAPTMDPPNPSGPIVSAPVPTSRFVRLNNRQWENTVTALLRLPAPLGLSSSFVTESLVTSFDTNGTVLEVATNQWSGYKRAAAKVANKVAREAPLLTMLAPPAADPATRAKNFIRDFGLRTFRRPLTDAEIARYTTLFNKGAAAIASGDAFADGVELVVRAFLQSPYFLYRIETSGNVVGGKIPLGDYEVAARLSYSLTNSMPDDDLMAAAASKKLQDREAVKQQAIRLIESPAGQAMVKDFHYQLLHVDNYDQISKDVQKAPAFTPDLNVALKDETMTFVNDVVYGQKKGFAELFSATYTFANSKVAKVYGMNKPAAGQDPFVRVELDPTQRAGLLTQAGFLSFYAEDQVPSIILRGARVAQDVLCVDIPPPPPNIPPLAPLTPGATNRKRVSDQTSVAPCNACHQELINPIGFAFENLDGFAQFRTQDAGQMIDASAKYTIDGKQLSYNGAVELSKLIAQSQQGHDCYGRHAAEYLYGRGIDANSEPDKTLIRQAGTNSKANASAKDLIVKLVSTDAFLTRAP